MHPLASGRVRRRSPRRPESGLVNGPEPSNVTEWRIGHGRSTRVASSPLAKTRFASGHAAGVSMRQRCWAARHSSPIASIAAFEGEAGHLGGSRSVPPHSILRVSRRTGGPRSARRSAGYMHKVRCPNHPVGGHTITTLQRPGSDTSQENLQHATEARTEEHRIGQMQQREQSIPLSLQQGG